MLEGKGGKKEGRYEATNGMCCCSADMSAEMPINWPHCPAVLSAAGEAPSQAFMERIHAEGSELPYPARAPG
jgi:hypothetical protein